MTAAVDAPEVETTAGRLSGSAAPIAADGGGAVFLGIPYAAPPVGPRRLRPPEPHPGWKGVRTATAFGAAPPQPDNLLTAGMGVDREEDCLTLNVWTPGCDDERRPVMVWIHGGGFTTGGSAISVYDGAALARRGVVVVTLNYRLGALGFLHLEAIGGERWAGAANLGLLDQAAALGWVAENVEAFGGDPERVTIFGESAGGMSVATQLALPASAGRFRGAIAQSGAARHVHDADVAAGVAHQILDALGVPATERGLERLADLPATAFVDAMAAASDVRGSFLPLPFQPTVDGSTLPAQPQDAVVDGVAEGIAVVAGTNLEEMRLWGAMAALGGAEAGPDEDRLRRRVSRALAARGLDAAPEGVIAAYRSRLGADAGAGAVLDAVGTDLVFRLPAQELVEAQQAHAPAFSYLFTHPSTSMGGILGAAHAVEIPFVFDTLDDRGSEFLVGPPDEARRVLARRMADCWAAFALTGDPSTAEDPWPTFDPSRRATKIWDVEPSVVDDPNSGERLAWR